MPLQAIDLQSLPEFTRDFVVRFFGNRKHAAARLVKAPEGITLVRCSWISTGFHRGGYVADKENVRWLTWADGGFVGSNERRGSALDYARNVQSVRKKLDD